MGTMMGSETMRAPDGPRFGPYVLTAELGRGGMGVVYRAYDTVKGRTVALKVLVPELAADRLFRDRFRRESRRAARLSEPHIIPIHDYGQIDGQLFIDMRLVEGVDLETLLERDGPLPPTAASWIIAQVASALDAAHAGGLVHRDVKPSNILITGHGQSMPFAYLIDFGIARSVGSRSAATGSATIGTLAYMAPERVEGAPGDRRVDVYSLACVLYECLTGRQPFTGEMVAVMWAQLHAVPSAPTAVRPSLPPGIDAVIARGMAKKPADRYGTAGDLAEAAVAVIAVPGAVTPRAPATELAAGSLASTVPPEEVGGQDTGEAAGAGEAGRADDSGRAGEPGGPAPAQAEAVPLWDSDRGGRALAALRAIVSDPAHGVATLSSAQSMSVLLKELLPDRPREAQVLAAAAEAGLAETLRDQVGRAADLDEARAAAAKAFARRTGFRPAACSWAVDVLAAALGLDPGGS
jgi:Protein kinase domain